MIQITEPIISYLSSFFQSTKNAHIIDEMIKIPPYAAYTLPKCDG